MKRNLENVTKDHVIRLERWVRAVDDFDFDFDSDYNHNYCPFRGNGRQCLDDICYDVFPRLTRGTCPCSSYKLKYVKRVARKIIKELS